MAFAAEISYFLTNYGTQLLGILILLIFYTTKLKESRNKEPRIPNKDYILCESPGCVRCTAYAQRSIPVLREEWSKYVETISRDRNLKLKRISQAMRNNENARTITSLHSSFEIPLLERQLFYQNKHFGIDVELLEKNWESMHEEYLKISICGITKESGWNTNSTPAGKWSAYYLVNQGSKVEENIKRCPHTFSIVANLNNFMSNNIFGNACFSVLEPGTHIEAHYGPCNIRARCHLGLNVTNESTLSVNSKDVTWTQGKCLIFDDYFLHSVTHSGTPNESNDRVILMVDFWNPNLNEVEKDALSVLLDPRKIVRT